MPYRGAGPAITDLLGSQVDMIFGTAAAVVAVRRQRQAAGHRRHLRATRPARWKGVPPIGQDVPGYQVESWYGLYAPAGTPADVIAKLNCRGRPKAAASPDFAKKIEQEGLSIVASDPARTRPLREGRRSALEKIVKENNIKPE